MFWGIAGFFGSVGVGIIQILMVRRGFSWFGWCCAGFGFSWQLFCAGAWSRCCLRFGYRFWLVVCFGWDGWVVGWVFWGFDLVVYCSFLRAVRHGVWGGCGFWVFCVL